MSELLQNITQIGIVTRDARAMMARYKDIYGVTDWTFVDGEAGFDPAMKAHNLMVHGKPQDFEINLAIAMVGNVEVELIQPLDDKSDYAMFLAEHGEGVHHIFIVTDVDAYVSKMEERGIPRVLQGTVPGKETFIYFDTRHELGMTTEIHDLKNK